MAKNGPKSWSSAKLRQRRPQSKESIRSHEQNVGRLARQTVSRPAPPAPPPKGPIRKVHTKPLQRDEKRVRTLNKVLREIEELQRREAAGASLDAQQLCKLGRLDDVLSELEALMGGAPVET